MSGTAAVLEPPVETGRPEPVIRTHRLTKKYGTLTAVNHLDLEVYPGEIFGLLGQNGAGQDHDDPDAARALRSRPAAKPR